MSDGKIETDIFQETDFSDGEASACLINDWVKKVTKSKIGSLIEPDASGRFQLDGTGLILVSGIYYKGTWESPFDAKDTRDEVVHFNIHNF